MPRKKIPTAVDAANVCQLAVRATILVLARNDLAPIERRDLILRGRVEHGLAQKIATTLCGQASDLLPMPAELNIEALAAAERAAFP